MVEFPFCVSYIVFSSFVSEEGEFKTRYNGHTSSFRNSRYKHATELSKYVWHLKESSVKYSIKWRIMKKCKSYSNKTKRCNLCLHEKFLIIYYPKLSSLNSRNELLSKCRHRGTNIYIYSWKWPQFSSISCKRPKKCIFICLSPQFDML